MGTESYEKLGAFYLGRRYDGDAGSVTKENILYDAKDLTTHAVCLGMTGSGKTGLCVTLLEEAAIDGVPAICIDPKGDLANLMLTFPKLRGKDFEPWVDPGEATRKGQTVAERAASVAKKWKDGLASWDQDGSRIERLMQSAERAVYTPGSVGGRPLSVLRSLSAPSPEVAADADALRERIQASVSGLCALLGLDADPVQSREHVFLSNVLNHAWAAGRDLELGTLVREVLDPPFSRIGVLDLESYYPAKERQALAMRLNGLLASPGFSAWMQGEPLDIASLLYTPEGKAKVSILSIAHLSEAERMFFVTVLLGEFVSWMRSQAGTPSLRALLYMDEVFGYLPPTANPPSKKPLLTLLKQARAYGVGVVLATQNPVDLDYKALSNCGTWLLGRLQTERDVNRVVDGLASTAAAFDPGETRRLLAGMPSRVFLMRNVHEGAPALLHSRWALSYLRGPLTRDQLAQLDGARPPQSSAQNPMVQSAAAQHTTKSSATTPAPTSSAAPQQAPGATAMAASGAIAVGAAAVGAVSASAAPAVATTPTPSERPILPAHVPELFVGEPHGDFTWVPGLVAQVRLHYVLARANVDAYFEQTLLTPLRQAAPAELWAATGVYGPGQILLREAPIAAAPYGPIPDGVLGKRQWKSLESALKKHLYQSQAMTLGHCKEHKLYSHVGESRAAFGARLQQAERETRDLELGKLRERYAKKLDRLEAKIKKAEEKVEREEAQASGKRLDTAIDIGTTVLGAFLGRRRSITTTVRRAASAGRRGTQAAKERRDVQRAEAALEELQEEFQALEAEFQTELQTLQSAAPTLEINAVQVRPRKADIQVLRFALAWVPGG